MIYKTIIIYKPLCRTSYLHPETPVAKGGKAGQPLPKGERYPHAVRRRSHHHRGVSPLRQCLELGATGGEGGGGTAEEHVPCLETVVQRESTTVLGHSYE